MFHKLGQYYYIITLISYLLPVNYRTDIQLRCGHSLTKMQFKSKIHLTLAVPALAVVELAQSLVREQPIFCLGMVLESQHLGYVETENLVQADGMRSYI